MLNYSNASSEKSVSLRKSETIQNMTMAFEKTSGNKLPSLMTSYQLGREVLIYLRVD